MDIGGMLNKAKDVLPDDAKIDEIAKNVKDKTPDQIDNVVDKVAEQVKKLNND